MQTTGSRLPLRIAIERHAASRSLFARANRVLAGGVSSSARTTSTGELPYPLYFARGHGSRIWDVDNNEFIDCLLSYGSVILGHVDPRLTAVLKQQLDAGTMFGTCNSIEVELAEEICRLVPAAEQVRFANSGSEAICGAVRTARGYTGRSKVLKFEGHYHGWVDVLAVSNRPALDKAGPLVSPNSIAHSRGTPDGVVRDVLICPWNEPEILRDLLRQHEGEIAAIVAEPIVANNACMMPAAGFLSLLREECDRYGIVLIFDEIVTGFRVAPGGAQELFNVTPDIAVFSKALGGGLPLSAFAGRREIFEPVAANTVKHGGTYNGNPLCAAAALHTLRRVSEPDVLHQMDSNGNRIIQAIRRAAFDNRVSCVVQGMGTMFQVVFTPDDLPLRHYRDLCRADMQRYRRFHNVMLEQGIYLNSSGLACWFISTAHKSADVDRIIQAIDVAIAGVR